MLYKRRFKEELSDSEKNYLKSSVSDYLYKKDKKVLKHAKEFILDRFFKGSPEDVDVYINELIKTMPKPQTIYNQNKKKFDDFFQIIKDIVGEKYSDLYDLYHKGKIRKYKDEIKKFYSLLEELNISWDFVQDTYNNWYAGLISGSGLITKVNGYNIPVEIAKYCNITKNIKDISEWKTRVRVGNNGGKKGEWDDISYVGISYNNILIPIAQSDEHRAGYEYLWFLKKKGIIKDPTKFFTIVPMGNSYFHLGYDKDQEEQELLDSNVKTLKVWLENTGWNIKLKSMAGKWEGNAVQFIKTFEGMSISDAQDMDYNREISPVVKKQKELSPTGKKVINYFEEIWDRIKKRNKLVFNSAYALLFMFKPYLDSDIYMKFYEKIIKAEGDENVGAVEDIVFGFFGIKNTIHNRLRSKDMTLKNLFGDIKLALTEFDKLGVLK